MAFELGFDIVLADRYRYLVVAVAVGLLDFTATREQVAIDIEHDALSRDVGAGIVDVAAHGERRHVLEVDVVGRQAGGADEHRACVGRKLVDAQFGSQLVVGAALLEGDTPDDIVALAVGKAIEPQQSGRRYDGRWQRIDTHGGVVELILPVDIGHVEDIVLDAQSFVERPVEEQSVLRSAQDARIVGVDLLLGKSAVPQTDVVDIASISGTLGIAAAAKAQRRGVFHPDAGVPLGAGDGHRIALERVAANIEDPLAAGIGSCDVGEVARGEGQVAELFHRLSAGRLVDGIEMMRAIVSAVDAQLKGTRQIAERLHAGQGVVGCVGTGPQLQRQPRLAVQGAGIFPFGHGPLQALALAVDISREELRLVGALIGRRLHQIDPGTSYSRACAVGDMARNGASCLREAGSHTAVGLYELLVALRSVGFDAVFVIRARHHTRIYIGIFRGMPMLGVVEQGPLVRTDRTAQDAELDVVVARTSHLPLDDDRARLRARRCCHLADIGSGRQVAYERVAIELLVVDFGHDAIDILVAH